jgi:hypothetical protein
MSTNQPTRIDLTDKNSSRVDEASSTEVSSLGRGKELESRINPLVVIAIIAVLIGLLLPAV